MARPPQQRLVRLDDERTWPPLVRKIFRDRFKTLKHYETRRAEVDRRCRENISARINPPANKNKATYEATIDEVSTELQQHDLVGYHCTRLHADDISAIKAHGLKPLSATFQEDRIRRRRNAGDIPRDIARKLLSEHQCDDNHRSGLVWFVFVRDMLRDQDGLERLFASWGGEAIYVGQEDHAVIGSILKAIGEPCIVEAAVPMQEIETFCPIGKRFYIRYKRSLGVLTESRSDMEGYVKTVRPIRRVITGSEFEELTSGSNLTLGAHV